MLRSRHRPAICALVCLVGLLATAAGEASLALPDHVPGEVLLKFAPTAAKSDRQGVLSGLGAQVLRSLAPLDILQLRLEELSVEEAIARYRDDPHVAYIEPNAIIPLCHVPDDPLFPQQWGLRNTGQTGGTPGADIKAVYAWDFGTGSEEVIVAVIDSGIDLDHPDLVSNLYTNPGEIPANGLDDDGNGYIDDVHGWNTLAHSGNVADQDGHGTAVAGILGAAGDNGSGVAGVAWRSRIMPVKWAQYISGNNADLVAAVIYVAVMNVDIVNCSFGWTGQSDALRDAFGLLRDRDILAICSAGNLGQDVDSTIPFYPACYDFQNIVTVAATNENDELASFSNRGAISIDVAAPGVHIFSTDLDGGYGLYLDVLGGSHGTGTSFAAPFVAGALALLLANEPQLTAEEARARLLSVADPLPGLQGLLVTGARLDLFELIASEDLVPPAAVIDLAVVDTATSWVRLRWTAPGDDGIYGRATAYDLRYAREPIDAQNFAAATPASGVPAPAPAGTPEFFTLAGLAPETTYHFALVALDNVDNVSSLSNTAAATTLAPPTLALAPSVIDALVPFGEESSQVLTLTNVGPGVLDYRIDADPAVPWLAAVPSTGYLRSGQDGAVELTFSAGLMAGGTNATTLHVHSNDPRQPDVTVPVNVTVTCEQDIAVRPPVIEFGSVGIGRTVAAELVVRNRNCAPLHVTEIRTQPGVFAVSAAPFQLGLAESTSVTVTFTPDLPQQESGTVLITSDDPDQPQLQVLLRGEGCALPAIALAPSELSLELSAPRQDIAQLTITNTGSGDLSFQFDRTASTRLALDHVLLFEESPAPGTVLPAYYDSALSRLSLPRVGVSSWSELGDSLADSSPWDLVVVNGHSQTLVPDATAAALTDHLLGGGRILFHDIGYSYYTDGLWSFFVGLGVSITGYGDSPRTVLPVDSGHPVFNVPNAVRRWEGENVASLNHYFRLAYMSYGQTELAKFEGLERHSAIVLNRERRSLFNAFHAAAYGSTDLDEDQVPDVIELIENQIEYLATAPGWFAPEARGGQLSPGTSRDFDIVFDARHLHDGEYHGEIIVLNNDPQLASVGVPVTLHVHLVVPELAPIARPLVPGWSLVGFPLVPSPAATVGEVLLDDAVGHTWLYSHTAEAGYRPVTPQEAVVPGQGFWLASETGFTWSMEGRRDQEAVQVPLQPGWNLVGYPLWFSGSLAGVMVKEAGTTRSFADAVAAGLVVADVLDFDTVAEAYAATTQLEPWHGYWLAALAPGLSLDFAYWNMNATVPAPPAKTAAAAEGWTLSLGLAGDRQSLELGERPGARDGFDPRWDWPEPPPLPDGRLRAHLHFVHPEWESPTGRDFLRDLRAPSTGPRCWQAELVVPAQGDWTLVWDAAGLPPERDFEIYLPDREQLLVPSLRQQDEVVLAASSAVIPLEIRTPAGGGPAPAPGPLALRCAPNPANPGTEFRFHLSAAGGVEVAIYDLRGAQVRRLVAGRREAGPCRLAWNGRDDQGRTVASGAYVYRLFLDGRQLGAARKLSVVK